jgi:pyruvate-ferredoxin/flavodoxin oxidoreductase
MSRLRGTKREERDQQMSKRATVDGNEAAASVAYRLSETIAIYPITLMACRQTGFGLLASNSVQEAQDMAAIAHAASLFSRVPFLHFFDGFRTSHELATIEALSDDDLRSLSSEEAVLAHRRRALTPDRPVMRGTTQNPDVFFQAREAATP